MIASRVFFTALSHKPGLRWAPLVVLLAPFMFVPAWGRGPDGGHEAGRTAGMSLAASRSASSRRRGNWPRGRNQILR
jgi:hypothetical protein